MAIKFNPKAMKRARSKADLSFEKLAGKIPGVSYGTIRNWEIGRSVPDANEVLQLAEIFGVAVERLYTNTKGRAGARNIVAAAVLFFWAAPAFAAVNVPVLMDKIIAAESSGRAHAVGDGGKARGLCQIQKATWERYSAESWDRAFDPAVNRAVGERIVRDIEKRYGARASEALVVYTYNTGRFVKAGRSLPAWTKKHPNRVYREIFRKG